MIEEQHGSLRLLRFEGLARESGLIHAVTTRPQNMACHRGTDREHALAARQELCDVLGLAFERLTCPEQVMGAEIITLADGDAGCGRDGRSSSVRFVDGLMTDRAGIPILQMSADCPLICAYDPDRRVVGTVHAGWQGTVAGAARHLIERMRIEHGCEPVRLHAAVAPSAGPMSYEVGEVVLRVARTRLPDADELIRQRNSMLTFDLWEANRRHLIEAGVPASRIEVAELDTMTDDRFWSHRRDGANAGRFALIVALV